MVAAREQVVRCGPFVTGWLGGLALPIRYATRPGLNPFRLAAVSHAGLAFEFADGHREIHEALLSDGYLCKPFDRLQHFADKGGKVELLWLDLPFDQVQAMWDESLAWIDTKKSYAWEQLLVLGISNSMAARTLRAVGLDLEPRSGPGRIVCSEATGRLMFKHARLDVRRVPGEGNFDGVSPQNIREWMYLQQRYGNGTVQVFKRGAGHGV